MEPPLQLCSIPEQERIRMAEALANDNLVARPREWANMTDTERFEFYRDRVGEDYRRRTTTLERTSVTLAPGEEDVPFRDVIRAASKAQKTVKGYKWLLAAVITIFGAGGTFAIWQGSIVTDGTLEVRVLPLEQRLEVVEGGLGDVKTGVSNMLLLQSHDKLVEDAEADVATYQLELDEQLVEWSSKSSRSRGQKPSSRDLVTAKNRLKVVRATPVILAPVNLDTGPKMEKPK